VSGATPFEDDSVDVVTVAGALHWSDARRNDFSRCRAT
jgi:hypothetical protein